MLGEGTWSRPIRRPASMPLQINSSSANVVQRTPKGAARSTASVSNPLPGGSRKEFSSPHHRTGRSWQKEPRVAHFDRFSCSSSPLTLRRHIGTFFAGSRAKFSPSPLHHEQSIDSHRSGVRPGLHNSAGLRAPAACRGQRARFGPRNGGSYRVRTARRPGLAAARRLEDLLKEAEALIHSRNPSSSERNSRALDGDAYATYPPSLDGLDAADPHAMEPVPLPEDAIFLFAEMVQIIDEAGAHRFIIQIGDPDLRSAKRRAELLRSSLLLALRHPSRLVIEEAPSSRPHVRVRAVDTLSMP